MTHQRFGITFFLLFSIVIFSTPHSTPAEKNVFQVSFIAISSEDEQFWGNIISMAEAAADDLNIGLEILYANRDPFKAGRLARKVCEREVKPDYLIIVGEKNIGSYSLSLAENAGIPTMLFGDLTEKEYRKYGHPRQKLSHWIGQRKVNDYDMGKATAHAIIHQALATGLTGDDGILNILGLGGTRATSFSDERIRGLTDAVVENNNVRLLQVVSTDWTLKNGYQKAHGLFQRYSKKNDYKIGAVWAANSQIALGAIQAGEEMGFTAGKDFFTSGIDWEPMAFSAVEQGKMLTISGGHFAAVAWILVMLYDYHYGIDFADIPDIGKTFQLNRKNITDYLAIFGSADWQQIDFTRFSRILNPEIKRYDFSFETIINQSASRKSNSPIPH